MRKCTCGADLPEGCSRSKKYCQQCSRERIRLQKRNYQRKHYKPRAATRACKTCGAVFDLPQIGKASRHCLECRRASARLKSGMAYEERMSARNLKVIQRTINKIPRSNMNTLMKAGTDQFARYVQEILDGKRLFSIGGVK